MNGTSLRHYAQKFRTLDAWTRSVPRTPKREGPGSSVVSSPRSRIRLRAGTAFDHNLRPRSTSVIALLSSIALLGAAPSADVVNTIREGLRLFRSGDFAAAAVAFEEADTVSPDNPTIAFNRGCAFAGQSNVDQANTFFRQAALARDAGLSAAAHYNLGCVSADQAKAVFGESPLDLPPEKREEGLALLTSAVAHYRDTLRVAPKHEDARHNLEIIRLWIKQMEARWAERDREKKREELDLLQFAEMLETQQRMLNAAGKTLAPERPSPRKRQAVAELEDQQRLLVDEIEPLKQKIESQFAPPPQQAGTAPQQTLPGQPDSQAHTAQAIQVLNSIADGGSN